MLDEAILSNIDINIRRNNVHNKFAICSPYLIRGQEKTLNVINKMFI